MNKTLLVVVLVFVAGLIADVFAENKVPIEIVSDVVDFQVTDTNKVAMAFPTVGSAKEVSAYLTNGNTIADYKFVAGDVATDKNHEFTKNALLVTSNGQWRLMLKSFNEKGYELKSANILPPFFRVALVIKQEQNSDIIMPKVESSSEIDNRTEIEGIPVPKDPSKK